MSGAPPTSRAIAGSFALDALLVVLFAAIGRASHDEDALAGLWHTAWPFLAGLVVGWAVTVAWRAPAAPIRTGLGLWVVTVVGGMVLRAMSGQGVVPVFVIVASIVLFLFLVGWRLIAALVRRRRMPRPAASTLES
ncbi:DUF3054 domain-containing protein [Microbacterium sp. P5_E9]